MERRSPPDMRRIHCRVLPTRPTSQPETDSFAAMRLGISCLIDQSAIPCSKYLEVVVAVWHAVQHMGADEGVYPVQRLPLTPISCRSIEEGVVSEVA